VFQKEEERSWLEKGVVMRFMFPMGRMLFALIFICAAPRHFTHEGIQHAADLGVPLASLAVPISGVLGY
jgi:putative oxidoreductase